MTLRGKRFVGPERAKRSIRLALAGIVLCAGCGCITVGPDYTSPKVSAPQAWRGTDAAVSGPVRNTVTSAPTTLTEWWKGFNDPVLDSLVVRAVEANLDIKLATSRIRQARASVVASGAALYPQLSASGSWTRSAAAVKSGSGNPVTVDSLQSALDASWEVDIFGGTRRNVEASKADLLAAQEDLRSVLVSLVGELGTDYMNLRGIQARLVVARRNLETQRHTADITRKRYETGFLNALDVANAEAQVAATEAQIPVLESAAADTIYAVGLLLGQEPAVLAEELSAEAPVPTVPPEIPAGLPSELLRRRPDIAMAEAQIHAAMARIGVATADLYPKFSLTGNAGFSGSDLAGFAAWRGREWAFGPSVSWQIFDFGKIRAGIEIQNALEEQALLNYRKTVLTALKEVESALIAYAKEQQHGVALTRAVERSRKAVELATTLYEAGKTDFLNVLTAQRTLLTSEDSLAQGTSALATDCIALYKALGGGWDKNAVAGPSDAKDR